MAMDFDLIDDYLMDRLSEDARDAFEIEMLDDPQLQSAVIVTRTLKRGLRGQQDNVVNLRSRRSLPVTWAAAATVMLAVSLAFNFMPADSQVGGEVDQIIYVEQTRSADVPRYEIPSSKQVLLSIDVGGLSEGPYDVTIQQGERVQESMAGLAGSPDDYLNLVLPPLSSGGYSLVVSGETGNRRIELHVKAK